MILKGRVGLKVGWRDEGWRGEEDKESKVWFVWRQDGEMWVGKGDKESRVGLDWR